MECSKFNKRIIAIFMLCLIIAILVVPFAVSAEDRPSNLHYNYTYIWTGFTQFPSDYSESIYVDFYLQRNQYDFHISTITYSYTYYGATGRRWNWGLIFKDDNNVTRLELNFSYYGYQIGGQTNVNNLPIDFRTYGISFSSPLPNLSYYTFTEIHYISGFTLTFDSQGGSSIAAESGVTDVILGDSTGYFPQYIPTRSGYEFLGWSLTPGGTYVRQVSLTEDTTIYANWRINDGWTDVYLPDNSIIQMYITGMLQSPSHLAVQNGHTLSLYYYTPTFNNDDLFFNEWLITEQLQETNVTETVHGVLYDAQNDIYKLDLTVNGNDLTVRPKIYSPHTCKLRWDSSYDNYFSVIDDIGADFYNGDYCPYYTYDGLHLILRSQFPYFYCRFMLYQDTSSAPADLTSYLRSYSRYDESIDRYVYDIYIDSPEDCVLLVYSEAIDMDYDPNDPVVSFDESGNAHWVVSTDTSFMDVDWDSVYSIIPSDFNGILGTIFNLRGLAIIGTICFTAAFAIWFVRRGG